MDITCKWCNRHLNVKNIQAFVGEIICTNSKCKGGTFVNITSNDPYPVYKQKTAETKPKEQKELTDEQ